MDPAERQLLERTLRLSEENNAMLKKIDKRARYTFIWGIIKIALLVVPLILGYLFLEPYLDDVAANYSGVRDLFDSYQSLTF